MNSEPLTPDQMAAETEAWTFSIARRQAMAEES